MKQYFGKILILSSAVVLLAVGCAKQQAISQPAGQTTDQSTAQQQGQPSRQIAEIKGPHFQDAKYGFSFDFPSTWHAIECKNDQGGKVEPNFIDVYLGDGVAYDCLSDTIPAGYYAEVSLLKNVEQSKALFDSRVNGWKDFLDKPSVNSILVDGKSATKISGKFKAIYANPSQSAGSPAVFIELPNKQDLFNFSYQESKVP